MLSASAHNACFNNLSLATAGVTSIYLEQIKSIVQKASNNSSALVFIDSTNLLKKLTNEEIWVLNVTLVGGRALWL
jgi:hypothetical protein